MSPSLRFTGLPVSEGTAAGTIYIADYIADVTSASAMPGEVEGAFAAVAAERSALAGRLRGAGRDDEAAIIDIGALIAADPALGGRAVLAVRDGRDAVAAVRQVAEEHAAVLQALPSPELAERAGDVREVAEAVLSHLRRAGAGPRPAGDFILVRRDVSPADLIELAEAGLVGVVSVAGGASSHAAIIARGLGVPMLTGVDAAVLTAASGQAGVLDADAGELIIGPAVPELAAAASANGAGQRQPGPGGPASTADGREITVLCNVASAAEARRGLAEGAAGVGLLRTEIPYSGALAWPTLSEHLAQLGPILSLLTGRPATVRLLDFSGDKIPPFLVPTAASDAAASDAAATGLAALLAHRTALGDQLRAALEAGRLARLAVLIPMVSSPAEVSQVRRVLAQTAAAVGAEPPPLGIMVELQATAATADAFAPAVDFFSIGTNDLTGQVLSLDRRDPALKPSLAAHPRVLRLIAGIVDAGRQAGIPVSVCGDSAADPLVLPLLVGLGAETLSVPAARVRRVRSWVADLDRGACAALAAKALRCSAVDEVWKLVAAR